MTINVMQAVLNKAAKESDPLEELAPKIASERVIKPRGAKPQVTPKEGKFYRPSRVERKFIGGHFDPQIAKQLRLLAAEEETTAQVLLEDALELLFVKKGKADLAELLKQTRVHAQKS